MLIHRYMFVCYYVYAFMFFCGLCIFYSAKEKLFLPNLRRRIGGVEVELHSFLTVALEEGGHISFSN